MSVINQALKDLQQRQQRTPGRARSVYQPPQRTRWPLWLAVAGGILAGSLTTYYMLAHATNEVESPGATPALSAAPEVLKPRLTEPQPHLAEQTDDLAQTALSDTDTVAGHLAVTDNEEAVAAIDTQVTLLPQNLAESADAQDDSVSTDTTSEIEATASKHNDTRDEASSERGNMRIERVERSAGELAQQRLEQAIAAQDSGQGQRAETLLQEALVLRPDFIDARQRLAAYYYGRGYSGQALRVLEEGLLHSPGHPRLLSLAARIHEEAGEPEAALEMLNRLNAELPENSDLVVLRAALANEIERFEVAADDYRALLQMNPSRGLWWLGLGYAEEGQGNGEAAHSAYQRALEDSSLNRESRNFARSRMEALQSW